MATKKIEIKKIRYKKKNKQWKDHQQQLQYPQVAFHKLGWHKLAKGVSPKNNRRLRKLMASNPHPKVVPTSQRQRRLGNEIELMKQEVIALLNTFQDARFEKRLTQEMGKGVFYVGEADLPANKDVFVDCDHYYCYKTNEYPYPERFRFSNKLVETVEDGEKWVFDGEQSS